MLLKNLSSYLKEKCSSALSSAGLFLIYFYQIFLSGYLGGNCRYYPTCSNYAKSAFQLYSPKTAFNLTIKRLFSCKPFGRSGFDPVPTEKDLTK